VYLTVGGRLWETDIAYTTFPYGQYRKLLIQPRRVAGVRCG